MTLSIRRGDFVIIFGTSGGGKTTMLNIIGTIDKPTKGQLFLFGNRITSRTEDSELAAIRSRKMYAGRSTVLLSVLVLFGLFVVPVVAAAALFVRFDVLQAISTVIKLTCRSCVRCGVCRGFVFQTFNLLSSMSAVENVEMPMILAGGRTADERRDRCTRTLPSLALSFRVDVARGFRFFRL